MLKGVTFIRMWTAFTPLTRIYHKAVKIDKITYDEILEMAGLGAGVMHGRSIEVGKKYNVPIYVRSSLNDNPER